MIDPRPLLELPSPNHPPHTTPAVIMAGGLGRRLGELTRKLPKPMLPLGHKPVLHVILERLKAYGYRDIYLCLNYKANIIREYFGDGSKMGLHISYVEESSPLGTAGALGFLKDKIHTPFLLMNGDLITTLNFESLREFHHEKEADVTLCLHEYSYKLAFGVVRTHQSRVLSLEEKPYQTQYVNAGIYMLQPEVLQTIQPEAPKDMTTVIEELIQRKQSVHAFHINGFWLDIGKLEDYEYGKVLFSQ